MMAPRSHVRGECRARRGEGSRSSCCCILDLLRHLDLAKTTIRLLCDCVHLVADAAAPSPKEPHSRAAFIVGVGRRTHSLQYIERHVQCTQHTERSESDMRCAARFFYGPGLHTPSTHSHRCPACEDRSNKTSRQTHVHAQVHIEHATSQLSYRIVVWRGIHKQIQKHARTGANHHSTPKNVLLYALHSHGLSRPATPRFKISHGVAHSTTKLTPSKRPYCLCGGSARHCTVWHWHA